MFSWSCPRRWANTSQAKLIAAVATTLLTFVFLAACTFLMALPTSVNAFAAFLRETGSAIHSLGLPASLLLALFVVLGIAIVYLHTYLSIAIGSLFTQHRKLASIIAFFALQFIAQILFMLVIYFVATHMEAFIDGLSQFAISLLSSPNGELKAFYGSSSALQRLKPPSMRFSGSSRRQFSPKS